MAAQHLLEPAGHVDRRAIGQERRDDLHPDRGRAEAAFAAGLPDQEPER